MTALTTPIDFWSTLKQEAQVVAEKEPLLSSYVHASVLAHHNFESSLSFILTKPQLCKLWCRYPPCCAYW